LVTWIEEALANAPTYGDEERTVYPFARLIEVGDILAGEVVAVVTRDYRKGLQPVLMVRLERDLRQYEAGSVVRFELDLVGLRRWAEVEQPQKGDRVVVALDRADGRSKVVRAKAL
jgi:hypothetical protein